MATPFRDTITADAPTSWWHLDETTGTSLVDAIAANNFTTSGTPTLNQVSLAANDTPNASIYFNNAALRYAERATAAVFRPTSITVEALVKSYNVNGSNRIIEHGPDDSWALMIEGGVLKFVVYGKASANYTWSGDTNRHHIVGTYNGTGLAILYLDGVEVGREQGGGTGAPNTTAGTLRLAGKPGSTAPSDGWNGLIDEVAIYNTVLTPTRILAHATAAGLGPNSITWKGYTWNVATRGVAAPYANAFSRDLVSIDGSGYLNLKIENLNGNPVGAELSSTTQGLGYGTYTFVIGSNPTTMHSNAVWGGPFPYGTLNEYGHREIDVFEVSKWSGATVQLSQTHWQSTVPGDPTGARGGYNAASGVTPASFSTYVAVLIWEPTKLTYRLYSGTTVNPANLLRESIVTEGTSITFNRESDGASVTVPAVIPRPGDERIHFNLWVCPNYGGGGDPTTVTAQTMIVRDFTFAANRLTPTTDPDYARIRLTVSGATSAEVNIWRVDPFTNELIPVRNADPMVTVSGAGEVYDYEAPLNVPVTYQLDDGGTITTADSVPISTNVAWLKAPGLPVMNQIIKLREMPKLSRQRPKGVHNVLNRRRPIVAYGTLTSLNGSMTLLTGNQNATEAMLEFLENNGVAYLQIPNSRFSEKYLSLGDTGESPLTRLQTEDSVDWEIEIVEVDRPDGGFEGNPTSTYDSLRDGTIATYTVLKSTKANYFYVMRGTGVPIVPPNPGSF